MNDAMHVVEIRQARDHSEGDLAEHVLADGAYAFVNVVEGAAEDVGVN